MQGLFSVLYLETTRKCNLNCPYCSTGSNKPDAFFTDLTTHQIIDRILQPAREIGTRIVNFSGGEFLLRPDAMHLLETAHNMGFSLSMATNGVLLDENKVKEIKNIVGDNLIISFGINSFDDENTTTRETEFGFVLDKINLLNKYQIRANISVTMGQFNKKSFAATIEKIQSLGLPFNRIPFVPRSCDRHDLMPDKKAMREDFHQTLRKYFNGQASYTPYFLPQETYEAASGQDFSKQQVPLNPPVGCWVGAYYAINPEGDVSPCPMFLDQVNGGNILHTNLKDILYESDLFKRMLQRDTFGGKCGPCRFNKTCGGCRVLAYYTSNDAFGEDPLCFIDELSEEEITTLQQETSKSFKNYLRMAYFGKIYQPPS